VSGVAFEPHGSTVEGAGGNTAEVYENNIDGQRLQDGSDAGWSGPTRVTACSADRAILQADIRNKASI